MPHLLAPLRAGARRWLLLVVPVVAVIAVAATFAFSSSGSGSHPVAAPPAGGHQVQIMNFSFHPSPITVAPGAQLQIVNRDGTTHTFTAANGAFDTGDIAGGATVTITAPTKPGTYAYHCNIHQYMQGVLKVT